MASSDTLLANGEPVDPILSGIAAALAELVDTKQRITSVQQQLRALQKQVMRERRLTLKAQRKKSGKASRPPSGFARPTVVSAELAAFLGTDPDAPIARTEVTQRLIKYVSDNSLQDEKDRRNILPNAQLAELLDVGNGDKLTYFNIQAYMNKHFSQTSTKN